MLLCGEFCVIVCLLVLLSDIVFYCVGSFVLLCVF